MHHIDCRLETGTSVQLNLDRLVDCESPHCNSKHGFGDCCDNIALTLSLSLLQLPWVAVRAQIQIVVNGYI